MNRVRCPNCGAPAGAGEHQCSLCGTPLTQPSPRTPVIPTTARDVGIPTGRPSAEPAPFPAADRTLAPGEAAAPGRFDLEGTVLNVSDLRYEPPDFNAYRFFSILLIILSLLPLVLIYIVFRIAFAIMLRMMGFRPGMSLFGHFFWIMVGRGAHGHGREEPVINLVVRTPDGDGHTVRIKGHLERGFIQTGDRIGVNGSWSGGSLLFRNGTNLSTGSELRLRPNHWKPVFIVLLVALVVFMLFSLSHSMPRF